jgi:hypothetical protein
MEVSMSIVRVGLAETKDFSEGYDAIFGKKEKKPESTAETAKTEEKKEEKPEEKKS